MTSEVAFRFWCLNQSGTLIFWATSIIAYCFCISLGIYLHIVSTWTTPLVLSIGFPMYLFLWTVAYTRWHRVKDFTMDWIVCSFGSAAFICLLLISLIIHVTEIEYNSFNYNITCNASASNTTSNSTSSTNNLDCVIGLNWIGFTIGAAVWTLSTTYLSFINWFNTFEKSTTLICKF